MTRRPPSLLHTGRGGRRRRRAAGGRDLSAALPVAESADLPPHVLGCRDHRLGDPALHARRPDRRPSLAHARAAVVRGGAVGLLLAGVRVRRPDLEAVPELLGGALPRRSRAEHPELPHLGQRADHERAALHARAARAGDRAQLLGREQGRRYGRPPQGARQHRPARELRAHRDPADVARDRVRLAVRLDAGRSFPCRALTASTCSRRGRSSS